MRNEKAPRTQLLVRRQTRRHPQRHSRHGQPMDVQIQTRRNRSSVQSRTPQPICSQRLHTNQNRTLLRKLRTCGFFRHSPHGLRLNRSTTLSRQSLRRVSRLHRKRPRRRHSTRILRMRRRLRRPSRVRLPAPQTPIWYGPEPTRLVQTLVHTMPIIRPTKTCHRWMRPRQVHEQQKKSTNQQPNVNLNDLAKHLTPLPIHDRVYADCPHATAILIVVTYVDDNLVFTNCATLRQTFAAHCNKRVRFNDEGPARWYLEQRRGPLGHLGMSRGDGGCGGMRRTY